DLRLVERPTRHSERLAVIGGASRLSAHAGIRVSANGQSALARLLRPDTDELRAAAKLLAEAQKPVLILGADVLNSVSREFTVGLADLVTRTGAKVLPIPAGPNSQGLAHLNLVPRAGGLGYDRLTEARAAFLSRLDPGRRARGFTIVHDTHLTETARLADVVLPAVTGYEKRGTTVNLEGRLLPLRQAALEAGEGTDLIRALTVLAEALGVRTRIRGLKSAQARLAERLGVDVTDLPNSGVIRSLGRTFTAPTGLTSTPQLWKPRMHPNPERRGSHVPDREGRIATWEMTGQDGALPVGGDD
ncbi:MAG: molybdopterin-dependent oxidoreductase, partial [Deinococcota bacterium]